MFSNIKRRVGVISAVAVLAALVPVLAASPASAALVSGTSAIAPQADATYDACPAGSASAAGFSDTTSTDVDCIKMHGITSGVTATTFEPSGTVPRWQMALFLTRFATSAGVTLGSGADQGFTDISGHSAEIQTAINQIKQLGVTTGTTATTYSPDSNVTREQMAMFVERLLGKTSPGTGACSGLASAQTNVCTAVLGVTNINILSSADADVANWNYTDIDSGSVTYEGHNAIVEIYHLGIPGDAKTDLTFRPTEDLTRGEMATWMKNALDHTNARPEGLWIQVNQDTSFGANNTELHISSRDASRQPVTGTLVDVFSDVVTTLTNTPPFSAAGGCNDLAGTTYTTDIGGATECTIAMGDASSNVLGNVDIAGGSITDVGVGTTVNYYAWTGAVGATYNNLTAPGKMVSASAKQDAASVKLTESVGTNTAKDGTDATAKKVKYGSTVTVTGQAIDNTASAANVAKAGIAYSITETVHAQTDAGNGTATHNNEDVLKSAKTTVGVTDANGAFTYDVTVADPSAANTTTRHIVTLTVTTSPAAVYAGTGNTTMLFSFDDDAAVTSKVALTLNSYSGVGVALAGGGVARTASATVYDQYGVVRPGRTVTFEGAATDGASTTLSFTTDTDRVTDSTGVATLGWTDVQTDTTKETISAFMDQVADGGNNDNTNDGAEPSADAIFYRLQAVPTDHMEVDQENAAIGTNFATSAANTGTITFSANTTLAVGDMIEVTTVPVKNAGGEVSPLSAGQHLYVLSVADGGGTKRVITVSNTRGGAAVTLNVEGDDTPGVAKTMEDWNGSDKFMNIVRWDDASNTLILEEQVGAGDDGFDYMAFTYDDNDQFMTNGDNAANVATLGLSQTPVSLAAFEAAIKTKMNVLTGYTTANATTPNDVFMLDANNHGDNPGVSVIHLGQ